MASGMQTQDADGVDFALEVVVSQDQLGDEEASMAIACCDRDVARHIDCCSLSCPFLDV